MVTGKEQIFNNIDDALSYVLGLEQSKLSNDPIRQKAPMRLLLPRDLFAPCIELGPNTLDYPLSAFYNDAADDRFIMSRLASGRYSLKPNLAKRMFLFRGETEFHSPCCPNIFRNPKQTRFINECIRCQELDLLMMSHPLFQLLDLGIELKGQVYRFEMNIYGLNQHYYNKTALLDLTSDPNVAAFFATTTYNSANDEYTPILDENHEPGVLYYYTLDVDKDFKMDNSGNRSPLSTIGLQIFPRSGKQRGYLYDLNKGDDFNLTKQLNAVRFKHNGQIAQRIFNSLHGGSDIFPDDLLTKHWNTYNKQNKRISKKTVIANSIQNPNSTIQDLTNELINNGFTIDDYLPSFTADELQEYYKSIENGFWEDFCDMIYIPGDDGSLKKAMLNVKTNPKYEWAFKPGIVHHINYDDGFVLKYFKKCFV